MFLRLLLARRTIADVLGGTHNDAEVQRKIASLERQQRQAELSEELARSIDGQLEILRQRIRTSARTEISKLAYIEAELERIEQQVELIREQAALSTDPELLSRRIDEITGDARRHRPVDPRSAEGLWRDGGPADRPAAARARRARTRESMTTALPRWAAEMRDLFRSGSAAQFLLHGSVFDVVPSAGKLLSVPIFLEQVMFATYDVVLRYDRSRGVRATRGSDDWGEWLQSALGREVELDDADA